MASRSHSAAAMRNLIPLYLTLAGCHLPWDFPNPPSSHATPSSHRVRAGEAPRKFFSVDAYEWSADQGVTTLELFDAAGIGLGIVTVGGDPKGGVWATLAEGQSVTSLEMWVADN